MLRSTSIRVAFENIRVMASAVTQKHAIIADHIVKGILTKQGVVSERDVNINVSDKTFRQLKRDGLLPVAMLGV